MATLSTDNRRLLERTIVDARALAERAARAALEALAVGRAKPDGHMSEEQKALRNHLRARARQLGDKRAANDTHEITHLVRECAYEHWHRMLFARFLAENNLLIEPDAGVAISLDECKELAKDEKTDLWTLAGRYAQRMLPQIFRADDPVLKVRLAREHELKLEGYVDGLPTAVFTATDSLGWCYQFWQTDEKKRVNESENKIGADELPAVTQLFTEDYMVDFLLDNTLGAWWAGRQLAANSGLLAGAKTEEECRRKLALPGCEWKYLRFVKDEKAGWRPAAGTFDGWPKTAKELKCMDPCCGSGHFLVGMFERLVALRMAEEGSRKRKAAEVVVRDNIFGLEIDPRCTQIAAFNLAMAAWKFAGHASLPATGVACSGIGITATRQEWLDLAPGEGFLMGQFYDLFINAPTLGSLIDPRGTIKSPHGVDPAKKMDAAVSKGLTVYQKDTDLEVMELGVTAHGIAAAFRLLSTDFHLVATNVPYLGRGKQNAILQDFCERHYALGKSDLATAFLLRCLEACAPEGVAALVTPQSWFYMGSYRRLREHLLNCASLDVCARLGTGAFQTISGEVVNVSLVTLRKAVPNPDCRFTGVNVSKASTVSLKAEWLRDTGAPGGHQAPAPVVVSQSRQLENPDVKILLTSLSSSPLLSEFADSFLGLGTGDFEAYGRKFWEFPALMDGWSWLQSAAQNELPFDGLSNLVAWDEQINRVRGMSAEHRARIHNQDQSGQQAWGKRGVAVALMSLRTSVFLGTRYDKSIAVLVPRDERDLAAIWEYANSQEFQNAVREVDHNVIVANGSLVKVPFDRARWKEQAKSTFGEKLPALASVDPSQWLFDGAPNGSSRPLQVAVTRLLDYRWPRQTGSRFPDCPALKPDGLEKFVDDDGVVCIPSVRGEPTAADRLLALLTAAGINPDPDLDGWLRNSFFEEHCKLFHDRPFVWHIWDGRKRDGFHALVNYHKLADGKSGRRLLEKLTHAYLGDWITRQRAEVKDGKEGADARLAAALALKERLEAIIAGEPPYDIFVRWKPLAKQPIGWEPDINDGVRMNIRPFMASDLPGGKKGAGVLRTAPKIKWTKDRGKEPKRPKDEYPWFWSWDEKTQDFMGGKAFDGNRWNDCHYSNDVKRKARDG